MIGGQLSGRHLGRTPAALVSALLTAACGGGSVTESVSAPSDASSMPASAEVSAPPASAAPSVQASLPPSAIDVPDDLPVDLADGGQVEGVYPPMAGATATYWVVRILYPAGSEETIVAFYNEWFETEGVEVEYARTTPGGDTLHRWTESTDANRLMWVTLAVADIYYGGADTLEVWYEPES